MADRITKVERRNRNIRLGVFALIAIIMYMVFISSISSDKENENILIGEDANVTINNKEYKDVDLMEFDFGKLYIGDKVSVAIKLPSQKIVGAMVEFRVYHSTVDVYLEDEKIYSYGTELAKKGLFIGSGTHFVYVPDNYMDKILRIDLVITENNAFTTIGEVNFQTQMRIIQNFLKSHFLQLTISIFLLGIGIMLIGLLFIYGKVSRAYRTLLWMAFISISTAMWITSSTGIIQLFTENFRIIGYIEYLSLDFLLLFFLVFVYELQYTIKAKIPIGGLVVITSIFILVSLISDIMNVEHISNFLQAYHMLAVVAFVITIVANFVQWIKNRDSVEGILLKGVVIMLIVLLLDLIRFNGQKYYIEYFSGMTVSILPIGIIVFIASMFAMYMMKMLRNFHEDVEKQTLFYIAYTDALTGISNRAKCERMFEEYNSNNKEYTIFNFDLNDFKYVNDTYGHSTGDNLLVDFSKIAKKIFETRGFIGRMGGDEFIGIIDTVNEVEIKNVIDELEQEIERANNLNDLKEYKLSVSYGYKIRKNSDDISIWDAYKLADKAMYNYKQECKKNKK